MQLSPKAGVDLRIAADDCRLADFRSKKTAILELQRLIERASRLPRLGTRDFVGILDARLITVVHIDIVIRRLQDEAMEDSTSINTMNNDTGHEQLPGVGESSTHSDSITNVNGA